MHDPELKQLLRKVALIEWGVMNRHHFSIPSARAIRYGDMQAFWDRVEQDIGDRVTAATQAVA